MGCSVDFERFCDDVNCVFVRTGQYCCKWKAQIKNLTLSPIGRRLTNVLWQVADVQPAIIAAFGNVQDLPWLGAAFGLGAVAILPWSKAYGIYNIKWLYIFHVIVFEAGSALCGAAPNMPAMIIGRVITGVGGSGMYMGCLMLLTVTTSNQERPFYMGVKHITAIFRTKS